MKNSLVILGQLSDRDIEWMIRYGHRQSVSPDTSIIRERVPAENLYVILTGKFSVETEQRGPLVQLGSGEIVGEMSFVDSRPPSATVRAVKESLVMALPRDVLQSKLDADAGFAARFYRAIAMFVSDRLRAANEALQRERGQTQEDEDELDFNVLDKISSGGERFQRIVKRLIEG